MKIRYSKCWRTWTWSWTWTHCSKNNLNLRITIKNRSCHGWSVGFLARIFCKKDIYRCILAVPVTGLVCTLYAVLVPLLLRDSYYYRDSVGTVLVLFLCRNSDYFWDIVNPDPYLIRTQELPGSRSGFRIRIRIHTCKYTGRIKWRQKMSDLLY